MTVSVFMGLPFAGMLRNLQFKAMGNPTNQQTSSQEA